MSFLGVAGLEFLDDMIIDSTVELGGDLVNDAVDFITDPSFQGAINLIGGYHGFGTNVGIDVAEDFVEDEILNPSQSEPTTSTSSTENGVTHIHNYYYGCPPCPRTEGGVFENAFDYENEEEEITFGGEDTPPNHEDPC